MMQIVLFCKSYINDFLRLMKLSESISKYNFDNIPFYISVPSEDYEHFKRALNHKNFFLLKDEDILEANPAINTNFFYKMPGKIQQQIIKSEFWRISPVPLYLCIDSDSFFIKNFKQSDFFDRSGIPYTTISDAHQLLDSALDRNEFSVLSNYFKEMRLVQQLLDRDGRSYAFGPTPVVWHKDVWQSLDLNYFQPNNITIMDAINKIPYELCWYGEALLKYQAIPLMPVESFFKVYHYNWQFHSDHLKSPKFDFIKEMYLGMVCQSNWYEIESSLSFKEKFTSLFRKNFFVNKNSGRG